MEPTGVGTMDSRWALAHSSGSDGHVPAGGDSKSTESDESRAVLVADTRLSDGSLALNHTLGSVSDAAFVPDHHTVSPSGERTLYLSVVDGPQDVVEDALMLDSTVVDRSHVDTFPESDLYRILLSDDALLVAPTCLELGARARAVRGADGVWKARLQFADRESLVALRQFCAERDIRFGLNSLYRTDRADASPSGLTDRRFETVRTAFENGYYDIPRNQTQDELATELGISTTAVSHRLRRATAQLVREELDRRDASEY